MGDFAQWNYDNVSGNNVTYEAVINYDWKATEYFDYKKINNKTRTGAIVLQDEYDAFTFSCNFRSVATSQMNTMSDIGRAGYCTFYPHGDSGNGYYGVVKMSRPRRMPGDVWDLKMSFVESTDEVRTFESISVKITNNTNTEYANYLWEFTINIAGEIAAGRCDSDGDWLRVEDKSGNALDFWYQPDTWNTAETRFWVQMGTVEANSFFYVRIIFDSLSSNPGAVTTIFDYYEDFEAGFTPGNLNGQDSWTVEKLGGSAYAEVGTEDANTGVEIYTFGVTPCDNVVMHRAYATAGINLLLVNHKKKSDNAGNFWFGFSGSSFTNGIPHDSYIGFLQWDDTASPDEAWGRVRKWVNSVASWIEDGAAEEDFTFYDNQYKTSYFRWNDDDMNHDFTGTNFDDQDVTDDTEFSSHSKLILGSSCKLTIFVNWIAYGKVPTTPPTAVVTYP